MICIVAPYNDSTTARMAVDLYNVLNNIGFNCYYLSTTKFKIKQSPIDKKIKIINFNNFNNVLRKVNHFIWFDIKAQYIKEAIFNEKINTVVINKVTTNVGIQFLPNIFNNIVVSSKVILKAITSQYFIKNITSIPWQIPGPSSVNKRYDLFIHIDRVSNNMCESLFKVLSSLFVTYPDIKIACYSSRRYSNYSKKLIAELKNKYSNNLHITDNFNLMYSSNLVFHYTNNDDLLYTAIKAQSTGIPVLTFKTPIASEFIIHNKTGYLIDTGSLNNDQPLAINTDIDKLGNSIIEAVAMTSNFTENLPKKVGNFSRTWNNLLSNTR